MPFDGVGFVYDESLEKLDALIDLLGTPDRWCKGALRSHDGRYCIRGAIRAVNGAELLEPAILQAIDQVVAVLSRARRNIEVGPTQSAATRLRQPAVSLLGWWQGAVLGWINGLS